MNNEGRSKHRVRLLRQRLDRWVADKPQIATLVKNAGWLMLDKVVRVLLALTMGAWVARKLGPAGFGELSYAVTLVALFNSFVNLGADSIVVRDLSRNPESASDILGTLFRLRLGFGVICWLLATSAVWLIRTDDTHALLLVAIIGASLVLQAADTIDLWFQSQSCNHRTVIAKLLSYVIANLFRIYLLLSDAPISAFAYALVLDAALLSIALSLAYRTMPTRLAWRADVSLAVSIIKQTWPFMLSGSAVLLYTRIDQILIREFLGEADLGIYSAALPLSQVWIIIPVTLSTALAPFISRRKMEGEVAYMRALSQVFRVFAWVGLGVSLLSAFFAGPVVMFLYGASYAKADQIIAIHAFTNIPIFLGVAQGLWLVNEGLGKLTLYRTAIGAAICVVANLLLIPKFGLTGAAATAVLSMFTAAVLSNLVWAPHIFRLQIIAFLPRRRSS
jgi:O-antigen/teichoic acid export membrane protein